MNKKENVILYIPFTFSSIKYVFKNRRGTLFNTKNNM